MTTTYRFWVGFLQPIWCCFHETSSPQLHHHHDEVMQSYRRCSDDDLRAVREEQGIPDLEEEDEVEVSVVEKSVHKEVEESEAGVDHGANVKKLMQAAITWHPSTSSKPSSCKSKEPCSIFQLEEFYLE
ncbi:hypothetical protein EZV62_011870 [Acer yangbiense]|uniref:Uncharacterized protein n=1 Tax=Acer yangbiense TaxID=1000413 RepID=A0A5C7I940_9ROSI|nr:hypothetical protein EZV62_011870 [Acer yangbiense]